MKYLYFVHFFCPGQGLDNKAKATSHKAKSKSKTSSHKAKAKAASYKAKAKAASFNAKFSPSFSSPFLIYARFLIFLV